MKKDYGYNLKPYINTINVSRAILVVNINTAF